MEVSRLASDLKFVNRVGQTLSPQERITLELAVLKLAEEYPLQYFRFWGRIEGIIKNYYIISAIDPSATKDFPVKRYFWRYCSLT